MKRWLVIAGLLIASVAHAQTVVQNGNSTRGVQQGTLQSVLNYSDSSGVVPGGDVNLHALYTADQSRDRDAVQLFNVMSGTNLAVNAADSSGVLDVHAYRYLKLLIKITPRTGANTVVRVAFQFRECANGSTDSSSVFPEYAYGQVALGAVTTVASQIDTTMAGHIATGSASVPWSGEYGIRIDGARSAPASGVAAVAWSYPNGISLPLDSFFGRAARFNKLQIRMRNMNLSTGVDYTIQLLGFAQ